MMAKILCFALALIMLLSCLAACGEPAPQTDNGGANNGGTSGDGNGTGDGNGNGGGNNLTGEEGEFLPAEMNFANYPFTMRAPKQDEYGTGHYMPAEGASDVINNALLERALLLQDMFGFIMELDVTQNSGTLFNTMGNNHKSQSHWVDALFVESNHSMSGAQRGNLWNLNLVKELNLQASYSSLVVR